MAARLILAQVLLWAGLCAARSAVGVSSETGKITVPEYLLPPHRRARSVQRLQQLSPIHNEIEDETQPRRRAARTVDNIQNVTDKILFKSFHLGDMRAKYVTIEWVGNMKAGVADAILVVIDRTGPDSAQKTDTELYRSLDDGMSFTQENAKVNGVTLDSESLLKNTYFPERALMFNLDGTQLWTTKDAGGSWHSVPFTLKTEISDIYFHPSQPDWFIALDGKDKREVRLTKDFGATFSGPLAAGAVTIDWGVPGHHTENTVFWTQARAGSTSKKAFDLYSTTDLFKTTSLIQQDGFDFALIQEYLFISVLNADGKTMQLKVSLDGGKTWNHAHFPVNLTQKDLEKQERAELGYQILDASEGSVFINVDNDNGLGQATAGGDQTGNLYTSDKSGTSYTLSLQNNLFLKNVRNDFHKVKSLVGTYITNQLVEDNYAQEFRSVITFDKGAIWKPINPPARNAHGDDIGCSECYLQLHNSVSEEVLQIQPIFSLATAAGLVIAHGNVGRFLSTARASNLYLSRDGGFAWDEILEGLYSFDVADHGGLILAVPVGKGPQNSVLFSWDYGTTWNRFQFQEDPIHIVKVLSKPGSATRVFNLWGNAMNGNWHLVSMDFTQFLGRPCDDKTDYTEWSPTDGRVSLEKCVLGHKRVYKRRKIKALCFNDVDFELQSDNITCPCTKEDFECDYGFYKPTIDSHCIEFPNYNLTAMAVCKEGGKKYYMSSGYRKVAGDMCTGGVENQYLEGKQLPCPGSSHTNPVYIIVPAVVALMALVGIAATAWIYNRKKNYWRSRYLSLAQMDHDDDLPHTGLDSDSDEDSDEELEIAAPSQNNRADSVDKPRSTNGSAAGKKNLFDPKGGLDDETELDDL